MAYITTKSLEKTVNELLKKWGVPEGQADIITQSILYAHLHEKHTHGITRMGIYKKKMDNKLMPCDTNVELVNDFGAIAVFDCNNGFGQIAAYRAMEESIHRAKKYGIGASFVRNSNNFGTAGFFGEIAANEGMVGLVISASGPAIAPIGGTKPIFGTNPICCAVPTRGENIVLDMAITEAARGKIRLAQKNGEKIPLGWAVDRDGNPTDDPTKALEGNMLAIGNAKGFGLSLVIDILAGLLSGSAFGGNIKPLGATEGFSRHGHMTIAIDIRKLMTYEDYYSKIEELIANVKECGETGEIRMPGESSNEKARKNEQMIDMNKKQIMDLNELAKNYQLKCRLEVVKEGNVNE